MAKKKETPVEEQEVKEVEETLQSVEVCKECEIHVGPICF